MAFSTFSTFSSIDNFFNNTIGDTIGTFHLFPTGRVCHYDFTDPSKMIKSNGSNVVNDNDIVDHILDKANNYTLYQKGSNTNYYRKNAGLGLSKSCIYVSGTSNSTCGLSTTGSYPSFPNGVDCYIVLRSTVVNNNLIINKTASNIPYPFDIKNNFNCGNGTQYTSTNLNKNNFSSVNSVAMIYSASVFKSNNRFIEYLNGSSLNNYLNTAISTSYGDGNNPLNVCRRADNATVSQMEIGEIIMFDNLLSDVDRQTIEGYLATKFNLQSYLPSSHPYKTQTLIYTGV
jgi:hypothetical protein